MKSNRIRRSIMGVAVLGTVCRTNCWIVRPHASRVAMMAAMSVTSSSTLSTPRVVIPRTRQSKSFRDGNPLIFAGGVAYTQSHEHEGGDIQLASLVAVEVQTEKQPSSSSESNKKNRKRGKGGRVAGHQYPHYGPTDDNVPNQSTQLIGWEAICAIIQHKVGTAIQTRLALNLPSAETDTYRLVNGEGDGVSGLAIDVLGGRVAVVMSSAAWCEIHRDAILESLENVLAQHPVYQVAPLEVIWKITRGRLQQDGLEEPPLGETSFQSADAEKMIITTESGIRYQSFPYQQGQKTGVYCDQRENRWNLALLCRDKRVLDLCCYHGGFSLNAKVHGHASSCTGVDSSQEAIDIATANAKLNGVKDGIEFVRSDIGDFMKQKIVEGTEYDVIVLDPPKLAPSVAGLDRATRKYHSLNRDALKLISPSKGGLFMTCTCSAAMTQKDGKQYFLNMVQQASIAAGRQITLLRVSGAASCHTQTPASYPAGAYLTAALFHVGRITT